MSKSFVSLIATALLAMALLTTPAWAQRGGGGRGGGGGGGGRGGGGGARPAAGFSGGARPAAGFSGGVRPGAYSGAYRFYNGPGYGGSYGYGYRPYYAAYRPFFGFYAPYYGYNDYWPGYYASYVPYYGGLGFPSYPLIAGLADSYAPPVAGGQAPIAGGQAPNQPQAEQPPRDGAAHLQLTVPENAEVLIDGTATTQTGSTREFVTPQLNPGSKYVYKVTVRSQDAAGKVREDTRDIRFQADDWFSIDFTRPPPPAPQAAPPPKTGKDE
jgi:uncharacterized protein (TIGR03000 family)